MCYCVVQQLGIDSFAGEGGSVEEHNTYQAMMQVCTSSCCPLTVDSVTLRTELQRHPHAQRLTLSSLCTQVLQASAVDVIASEHTDWPCFSCSSSTVVTPQQVTKRLMLLMFQTTAFTEQSCFSLVAKAWLQQGQHGKS